MAAGRRVVRGSWGILAVSFLLAVLSGPETRAEPPPGAGDRANCLVKTDAGVLVVKRVWTRRLDLPGGRILAGEAAERAAERGTFEETGVAVTAGPILDRESGRAILRCVPGPGALTVLPGWSDRWAGPGYRMPVPLAARDRVDEARLVDLSDPVKGGPKLWRSPSKHDLLVRLTAAEASAGAPPIVLSLEERASELERRGLGVIRRLQAWGSPRLVELSFRFLSFLGEEAFYYLWIPLLFLGGFTRATRSKATGPREPWALGARLALLLCATAVVNGLLKGAFQCSRPLDWAPAVQWSPAEGYGFPSGHTQLATAFFGYLAWALPLRSAAWRAAVAAPAVLTGVARVYLGVHYPHDVLGGWVFSGLLLAGFVILEMRGAVAAALRPGLGSWGGLAVVAAISLTLRPHPDTLAALALWTGVLAGITGGKSARAAVKKAPDRVEWILRGVLGAAGVFALVLLFSRLAPSERTTGAMALHRFVEYAAVGLWLSWGSFWAWARVPGGRGAARTQGRSAAVSD